MSGYFLLFIMKLFQSCTTEIYRSTEDEYFFSLENNLPATALLIIFVTKLSSGFLLYLFQNSSVFILEWEVVEDEVINMELDKEELDSDDALERNENVESFSFCLPPCLSKQLSSTSVL